MSLEDEIERKLRILEETEEKVEFPSRDDVKQMEITEDKDEQDGARLIARYRRFFKVDLLHKFATEDRWYHCLPESKERLKPDKDVVELLYSRGQKVTILYSDEDKHLSDFRNPKIETRINRAVLSPDGKRAAFEVLRYRQEDIHGPTIIKDDGLFNRFYLRFKRLYVVCTDGKNFEELAIDLPPPARSEGGVSVVYPEEDYSQALTGPVWTSPDTLEFTASEHMFNRFREPDDISWKMAKIDCRWIVGLDFDEALSVYKCRVKLDPLNGVLESSYEVAK